MAVSPIGEEAEQFGLRWLFQLRGPVPPPRDVVVIAIDMESGRELRQGNRPATWNRALHAGLIDALSDAGARVIVLDVFFELPGPPPDDRALADALHRAGNVVLAQRIDRTGYLDRLRNPAPVIENAAPALAPFPLPKVPEKVSFFWPYYTATAPLGPDQPTLCHGTSIRAAETAQDDDPHNRPEDLERCRGGDAARRHLVSTGSSRAGTRDADRAPARRRRWWVFARCGRHFGCEWILCSVRRLAFPAQGNATDGNTRPRNRR